MASEGDRRRTFGLRPQAQNLANDTDEIIFSSPALAQAEAWIIPCSLSGRARG